MPIQHFFWAPFFADKQNLDTQSFNFEKMGANIKDHLEYFLWLILSILWNHLEEKFKF